MKQKRQIRASILRWYRNNARELPWRGEHSPYRILVSEVMLQQTQVSRVLTKFHVFLGRFPTLSRLAAARTSAVIKAWEGMGYNNRAIRLQKLALAVMNNHKGKLPESIGELQALPGIGRYTAHALACFSFGQHVPVVDTNVRRVLTRLSAGRGRRSVMAEEEVWDLAKSLLPSRRSYDWNQALMDLGATVCTAAQPKCGLCPLVRLCPSAYRARRMKPLATKPEPQRDGIPNRIYRGRTIQALRKLKSLRGITRPALARKIKPDYKPGDDPWLDSLLRGLQKDGLIQIRGGNRIFLPEQP